MLRDRWKLTIEQEDSRYINLLLNKKTRSLTIFADGKRMAFLVFSVKRSVQYKPEQVKHRYSLKGFLDENARTVPLRAETVEQLVEQQMKAELKKLLDRSMQAGIDILGIGEVFRQRHWDTTNWEEQLQV